MSKSEDFEFADAITLLPSTQQHAQVIVIRLQEYAAQTGLRMNKKKVNSNKTLNYYVSY